MALATLHDTTLETVDPPWNMKLSHSDSLEMPLPEERMRILPQFVKTAEETHFVQQQNAQALFALFRVVGPLVAVRSEVDIGFSRKTCVVHYWKEEHARAAQDKVLGALKLSNGGSNARATLQAFDPCDLFCGVSAHYCFVRL